MPLTNVEKAKYKIAIDRENAKLLLNKEYKAHRSLTILFGALAVSMAWMSLQSGFLFAVSAVFFGFRWQAMEKQHLDSQEKIQRYESILSLEPE
ncbi:MAG: hypothetical protein WDZ52_10910 [Pseudohongiellaceae bacterium]